MEKLREIREVKVKEKLEKLKLELSRVTSLHVQKEKKRNTVQEYRYHTLL